MQLSLPPSSGYFAEISNFTFDKVLDKVLHKVLDYKKYKGSVKMNCLYILLYLSLLARATTSVAIAISTTTLFSAIWWSPPPPKKKRLEEELT